SLSKVSRSQNRLAAKPRWGDWVGCRIRRPALRARTPPRAAKGYQPRRRAATLQTPRLGQERRPRASPPHGGGRRAPAWSVVDFRRHQLGELLERLLPAEIAALERDHVRNVLLLHGHLRADRYGGQGDDDLHLVGQVRVVELVRVDQALVRHELE